MFDLGVFDADSWAELEKRIDTMSVNDKGDAFEYFVYYYLQFYKNLYNISEIYCPVVDGVGFPESVQTKLKLESYDHGVDGVYITHDGEHVAWQAKFRGQGNSVTAKELSTFWSEAENADYRLIVSNVDRLPNVAKKKHGHKTILVDVFLHIDSSTGFFRQLKHYFERPSLPEIKISQKKPRPYQRDILDDIRNNFVTEDKGKVIAACGIGKTLISLWSIEEQGFNTTVFFAPSLQLIRQTLGEWSLEATHDFNYLCVCSDETVDSEFDGEIIRHDRIDIPVSTDPEYIVNYLNAHAGDERLYVFCTYQSAGVLGEALSTSNLKSFDIAIFDEAHRTTGVGSDAKFSLALQDSVIRADKKLFLTATERLIRPRTLGQATERGVSVFSMGDEAVYGKVFHRLTFGQAIEKNIISDYEIVLAGVSSSDYDSVALKNKYVADDMRASESSVAFSDIYKHLLLKKCIEELGLSKIISFHSRVSEAKSFAINHDQEWQDSELKFVASHIDGGMSTQERSSLIRKFELADIGLLSNVRCLTEGVDIPQIDGVFFADPKGSLIDIVQAVGRALRQPYGEKGRKSYIVIPILLEDKNDDTLSGPGFEALFNLIQALRDQDESLAEWIDSINMAAVKGSKRQSRSTGKIKIIMPEAINLESFVDKLTLRIAEVNKNPTGTTGVGSKLGKTERKKDVKRVLKTIGDYTPLSMYNSLIAPTLEIVFSGEKYKTKDIKINNNNVSHARKLGVISEVSKGEYEISPLGLALKNNEIVYEDLFVNQILLYKDIVDSNEIYPYRVVLEVLSEVGEISFHQYYYSLYAIKFKDGTANVREAIDIIKDIGEHYPNLQSANDDNKHKLLDSLNKRYGVSFSYNNVWTDRTNVYNQFRFLSRHLELLDGAISQVDNKITLLKEKNNYIKSLLSVETKEYKRVEYGSFFWNE
ncbi:DEAD/DEAH box helicase family protein [Vibrio vulnificus]|uniref:DEAD/DEAH box helicase family protein n=1 Tax=Vibrio vulnificus TaxID=672 RepID=UPI0040593DD5